LTKIKQIAQNLGRTDGAEIAEAALVLPLVFMFLLGIVWFGRAFNIYSTIQQAAQQGAITAAREPCATCTGGNNVPSATAVDGVIVAVLKASNLDATQIKLPATPPNCATGQPCSACPVPPAPSTGSCSSANSIYVCQNVQLNPSVTQSPQCGTVVSFQYPFQFYLPFTSLNMQTVTLSAQAQSRMEN
jgi:TadE-like protein